MKLIDNPPLHLTYCLNVHPCESWDENFATISKYAVAVRVNMALGIPFGLGLRLSNQAANSLFKECNLKRFSEFLADNNMYVFTVNAFPFGSFHGKPVKETVYSPDWRTKERKDYTVIVSDILAYLLPDGLDGSISTVPCSYKEWITCSDDAKKMLYNIMDCVIHLAGIYERTGKNICLALEPEPDCYIETTVEILKFFEDQIMTQGMDYIARKKGYNPDDAVNMVKRHLGVCLDTCHLAVQFEDLIESLNLIKAHGIRIAKIQLSSAIKICVSKTSVKALEKFIDNVYLHQTRIRGSNGKVERYNDLTCSLINQLEQYKGDELRTHFHVPLYFSGNNDLDSTANLLSSAFFKEVINNNISQLEIETYTFDVLPSEMRSINIIESISKEYEWVLARTLHEERQKNLEL